MPGFHPRVKQPVHWQVVRLVPRQPDFSKHVLVTLKMEGALKY